MLSILVGNESGPLTEVLEEGSLKLLPAELVEWFVDWYKPGTDQSIRVYTDTLVNYIGFAIDEQMLDRRLIKVYAKGEIVEYTVDGVIGANWPQGIFNWYG
jgi:hypothetical protein